MSKYLSFVFFILLAFVSKGQVYQSMPQWGYGPVKRFDIDSSLTIPTTCGVPTLKTTLTKKAAIAFDSCNNKFYKYNPKTQIWSEISGTTIDTTSLSNRIDLRVKYSDTSLMLQNYLKEIDTASLSSRIDLKLFISDTTNKWVTSVTKVDDSTIRVVKGTNTTDIVLSPATSVTAATRLQTQVYNNSGSTITKGSVIYINGRHSSNLPTIALAQANTEQNSYSTFALVLNDIPTSSSGTVIQAGNIGNLNLPTSSYTDGDLVYLSPSVAGGITTTKPLAPNHIVKIGTITRAHPTFGSIELKIENGWQLDELSDVKIALVPNDSTLLQFSRVDSLWHDVSPTTAIGSRYIKPSDTATMLTNYVTNVNYGLTKSSKTISADTSKLSTLYQTNLKVKYTDTASMLTPYVRTITLNGYVKTSDTSSMLTPYLRSTTASGTYATISSLSSYLQKSDSSTYYTKYRSDTSRTNIYNQILGKQNTLTNPVTGTGTSGSLTKFNGTSTITDAVADVDYLQQDLSLVVYQAMGSSIKGYNVCLPNIANMNSSATLTSPNLLLTVIYLPKAATITGVRYFQYTSGTYTANNYNGVGLYSVSGGTLTLVASSTNDGNIWKASGNTWASKAFTTPYSASAGLYYLAALYNTSSQATPPSIGASTASTNISTIKAFDFGNGLKLTQVLASQSTLPSTITSSVTTYVQQNYAFYLY